MTTSLEQFTSMVAAIAESACQSQLGKSLRVTGQPGEMDQLDVDETGTPKPVTGHFSVVVDRTPGSLIATLLPTDDPEQFDFELVIALEGSGEEIIFSATVEDTVGLADTYQALLAGKRDPGEDTELQNTVA
ncbi:hypothetical protein [Roseomonas sp. WA12]